jgi:aconitate hydratase
VAENLTRKILEEHLVEGDLKPGEPISLRIDQTLLQDATGTMAFMQYEQLDVPRVAVDRAVQYIDHNVVQLDFKNPDDHRMLQALCPATGSATTSRSSASPSRATSSSAPTRTRRRAGRWG